LKMTFAVVGFDLGFQNSYVAIARSGGIETVANEYSDRCTSSCISFTDTMRFIGNSARQRCITNMRDTLHAFTKFVGKDFDDPAVQAELPYLPYRLVKVPATGCVGFRVNYLGKECIFSAEQAVAMMLGKLRSVAESNLDAPVTDCVLNVPIYYDDRERQALLDSASIAGLNCLKLINDIAAIALSYGFYRKDLPTVGQPPRIVLFVDMGHCHLQVGLVAFNANCARILSTASDANLGGRDFDRALFNHFVEEFNNRLSLDVRSSLRAQLKLLDECARVKKLMSANSADLPVSVECILDERDASGCINRATFASLLDSAGLLRRLRDCIRQCLTSASPAESAEHFQIHSVELVGGSTRVPAVKSVISDTVSQYCSNSNPSTNSSSPPPCRTTLNADEAIARGCALMCALLSPVCRVARQFDLMDQQPYSISLAAPWRQPPGLVAFPAGCRRLPSTRRIGLPAPVEAAQAAEFAFDLAVGYTNRHDVAVADRQIAQYRLTKPQGPGNSSHPPPPPNSAIQLKLRLQLNCHGLLRLTEAWLEELLAGDADQPAVVDEADGETGGPDGGFQQQQQQVAVHRWALPLKVEEIFGSARLSAELLAQYRAREQEMVQQEHLEQERISARNSVEEYVYEMRERLASGLANLLTDVERVGFVDALDATEAWLYGDGERLDRQAYVNRLADLRREGDAYCQRLVNGESRGGSGGGNGPSSSKRCRPVNGMTS
uniref:Heat shock 70 kDa protein 16 n=1 Tax=Macrostomum lignano TaxID=282301 RepID=A0A1I8GP42_9PLAT